MKDKNGKSALPAGRAAEKTKRRRWPLPAVLLAVYDFVAIHIAYFAILWIRFDCVFKSIPDTFLVPYSKFITVYALCCLAVFWLFRMYNSIWRFASYTELSRILIASVFTSVAHIVLITVLFRRMPMTYYIGGMLLQLLFVTAARFSYRFLLFLRALHRQNNETAARVMLIGAGSAGQMILRDIRADNQANDKVVCVIDDDPNKWNMFIEGVPVVGGRDEILASVEKYKVSRIYLAIPSASAEDKRDILNICSESSCELLQLPGIYQLVTGQVSVSMMREVAIEDLLGRDPISPDLSEVFAFIHGKTVLVTGGGGSIGSELCRQIAEHGPKQLIIFDVYENNAYEIQLELRDKHPDLNLAVLIGSVRDSRRMMEVFAEYRPEIVYHAAAHKHVPLMEDSPCEAIKNNSIGTYKTAYAAMVHGCERFVLISTDKAVNPTNIMGASKRLCEMIIQSFDSKIKEGRAAEIPPLFTHEMDEAAAAQVSAMLRNVKTEFVAVRFGNVLGSNGSVIPIFKKQIEKGGPVTVTHPDIIRYFMTIPEAVSLVLLAGTYAHGGEIFVLDMGSPVKIDTLARNLIKKSGFVPDVDIKIEYTGLRPGEKLYEERLMAEEGLKKTENEMISIGCPIPFEVEQFFADLNVLMNAAYSNSPGIHAIVEHMVTTYHPANKAPEEKTPVFSGSVMEEDN